MRFGKRVQLTVLICSAFVSSLSQYIVVSALPAIINHYNVSVATGQWLTTSYIMVMGVITAVSAYLFKSFGTKPLIIVSLVIFSTGCLISLFSRSFGMLLISRIIQAVGGGALLPVVQIILLHIFPPEKQGQAIGLTGIVVGFAPALGPAISGLLVDSFGWRSIFLFLIAFSVLTIISGIIVIDDVGEREKIPMDLFSVFLYIIGFFLFTVAVNTLKSGTAVRINFFIMLAGGIAALYAFSIRQLRQENPILKLSLLKGKSMIVGIIILSLGYMMNMVGSILVPLFNQSLCGYSATVSGLIILPGSLLVALFCTVGGRFVDKYGAKIISIFGMIMMIIGNAAFLLFNEKTGVPAIVLVYSARCIGFSLLITPSTALAVHELSLNNKSFGMAIANTMRQMSASLISAVLVTITAVVSAPSSLTLAGLKAPFIIMTVLSVLGLFVCLMIPAWSSCPQKG